MRVRKARVSREDVLAVLEGMRLMDDVFMELCFKDAPEVVQLVLRIVLSMPKLRVDKVTTQEKAVGIGSRAVCFDVLAQDERGNWYNIEIQRDKRGATPRRSRYHSSMLDVHLSRHGMPFDELPNAVVVFITETDTLGYGEAVTAIKRCCQNGRLFNDGQSIVYVNGEWQSDDDVGHLMSDFKARDASKMYYEVLRRKIQSIKEPMLESVKEGRMSEETRAILSKYGDVWFADGMQKGMQAGVQKTARAMLDRNLDVNIICECTGLTIEEVAQLAKSTTAKVNCGAGK